MKDLRKYVKACCQDLDRLGIPYGTVSGWVVNSRAKTRWGACRAVGKGEYEISIAGNLLEDGVDDQALKDTIVHELLHTVPGCFHHRGKWMEYAKLVNERYPGYTIKRTASRGEKGLAEPEFRYIVQCRACGAEFPRMRESTLISHPERYRCGKCRGELIRRK